MNAMVEMALKDMKNGVDILDMYAPTKDEAKEIALALDMMVKKIDTIRDGLGAKID